MSSRRRLSELMGNNSVLQNTLVPSALQKPLEKISLYVGMYMYEYSIPYDLLLLDGIFFHPLAVRATCT